MYAHDLSHKYSFLDGMGWAKITNPPDELDAFKAICSCASIPYQVFHKNSDVRGGSTLGNISTTHVSVPGVDIGLPQLAMHSSQELCHTADVDSMLLFFSAFYAGARPMTATCEEAVAY